MIATELKNEFIKNRDVESRVLEDQSSKVLLSEHFVKEYQLLACCNTQNMDLRLSTNEDTHSQNHKASHHYTAPIATSELSCCDENEVFLSHSLLPWDREPK